MTDLRRMFYNRYKTSTIFSANIPGPKPSINKNPIRGNCVKNDTFIPKYNKMTSKERYWHEMRYKEFGHSNKENKKTVNILTNSDGCRLNGPISIHELASFILLTSLDIINILIKVYKLIYLTKIVHQLKMISY